MKPKAISLFSGAGGMDIGMSDAGFDVKLCLEVDPSCCDTLRHNLKNTKIIEGDIRDYKGADLLSVLDLEQGDIDLVFGGPPCQSFSLAGHRQGLNDPRGELVFEFVRLVQEIRPKAFIMENVKGMATWQKGQVLRQLEEMLAEAASLGGKKYDYKVSHSILNAADYGVPQNRERVFIVGVLGEAAFQFPSASRNIPSFPKRTVGDILSELPEAQEPSDVAMRVSKTIKGRIETHGY